MKYPEPYYDKRCDTYYVRIRRKLYTLAKGKQNREEALLAYHRLMVNKEDELSADTSLRLVAAFWEFIPGETREKIVDIALHHYHASQPRDGDGTAADPEKKDSDPPYQLKHLFQSQETDPKPARGRPR